MLMCAKWEITLYVLCRISEMYVADESHTDGRIPVQIDVVFPKMQCICKLLA